VNIFAGVKFSFSNVGRHLVPVDFLSGLPCPRVSSGKQEAAGVWEELEDLCNAWICSDGRGAKRMDQSQGLRCSSSIWRLLVGHRRGWLEQLVLWLFRLSVDSDDPEEEEKKEQWIRNRAQSEPSSPDFTSRNSMLILHKMGPIAGNGYDNTWWIFCFSSCNRCQWIYL